LDTLYRVPIFRFTAHDLRPGTLPRRPIQDDFTQGPGTLLEKLEKYIAACDRVVLLIGSHYGAEPTADEAPAGSPRRSYTQWEYSFAIGERLDGTHASKKELYVYLASQKYRRGRAVKQTPECAELQRVFVETILNTGKDRNEFSALHELRALVLRDLVSIARARKPNNLPYASLGTLFKGREDFLEKIHTRLSHPAKQGQHRVAAITSAATVYGLGGIGKTRAGVEFAHRHADDSLPCCQYAPTRRKT